MEFDLPPGTTPPRGLQPTRIKWPLVPAREMFELKYGRGLIESRRRPGPVPVYGTNGRCGTHNVALFPGPGVILGRKGQGPLGVEWSNNDYWVIDTAYSLTPLRADVDLRYSYFMIKFVGLNHLKDGTSNPSLTRDSFGSQALPLPPLPDQRAIAQVLGSLENKIELNRQMSETLEGIARAIFKSWFVDFDPVRAKTEVRQRFGMGVKTAALFPESLADSELGPIPEGWEVRPIGDAVGVVGGSTPSTKEPAYWGGPHFFATPKELAGLESRVLLRTERTISDSGLQRISSGLLPPGTVLLSSRAPIGYVAISEVPVAVNQGFIAMVCNKDLPPFYVMQWAASNVEIFKQNAGGTTFAEINKRSFRPIPVLVPPKPLLDMYEAASKPLYERIAASLQESDTLVRLRDVLLPRLMSGEVRIRDAEQMVEAAL